MKRASSLRAVAPVLTLAPPVNALATETVAVCYPTPATRSEDGTELKKICNLASGEDSAGIPWSDFEQDGFRYALTGLLKQDLLEHKERQRTEVVSLPSKNKDMALVPALPLQKRGLVTDGGLVGTLTLQLDTARVEVAGYGSSTKEISATRSYPNLVSRDTQYILETIGENGKTLTLKDIDWQTDNTATSDGYAPGDRYIAVAVYTGPATSNYVKGYTVIADCTGATNRIVLNRTRYVAIFEGMPLQPVTAPENQLPTRFNRAAVLVPFDIITLVGVKIGAVVFIRRRREAGDNSGEPV